MNKLVSRNPVLRFKEGKVLKYQNAPGPLPYKRVNTVDGYGIYTNDGGKTFVKSPRYKDWDPNNHVNDKDFSKKWEYIPEKSKYAMFQGRKYQRVNDNEYWDITDIKNPKRYTSDLLPFKYVLSANAKWKTMSRNPLITNREEIQEIPEISVDSKRSKNGKPSQTGRKNNSLVSSGFIKGYLNTDDIQNVINQYGGIKGFQQFLIDNKFLSGDRSKKEGADGWWGENTQKAYEAYLLKNAPILPTSEQLIQLVPQNVPVIESTPQSSITKIIPQTGTNTIQNQLSLMQLTLPVTGTYILTPTYVTADRSQTRDWMRSNGINPYSVTGAMRAAARRIRAGQADDNDRLLVKGNEQLYNLLKGYYKQGGNINKLPSRNIVERFKQRNFR